MAITCWSKIWGHSAHATAGLMISSGTLYVHCRPKVLPTCRYIGTTRAAVGGRAGVIFFLAKRTSGHLLDLS